MCLYCYLSVCLSVHLNDCLSVCLSIYLSVYMRYSFKLYVWLLVYIYVCLSVCLQVCLSVYLYVCLSVYQSVYQGDFFVYQSVCQSMSVYLHICMSFYLSVCLFNSLTKHLSIILFFHTSSYPCYPWGLDKILSWTVVKYDICSLIPAILQREILHGFATARPYCKISI